MNMLLGLAALSLQPAPPAAQPASPIAVAPPPGAVVPVDSQRETVIATPSEGIRRAPPVRSRIRRNINEEWAPDSMATMLLREWATCTVRINRTASVALMATPLNSPEQSEIIDRITGRRFTRLTVCARFRRMRVDNLVLRGAIAEALHRWEADRRRSAGSLGQPGSPAGTGPTAILSQAAYCVMQRQPDGVGRVMETRPWGRAFPTAIEALRASVDACLPDELQSTDFHPLMLRGALGEPYLLINRTPNAGGALVNPGADGRPRS